MTYGIYAAILGKFLSTALREIHYTMKINAMKIAGFALLGIGMSSACFAAATPEIDPASGASALAMLAGAMLMIRGRRRR